MININDLKIIFNKLNMSITTYSDYYYINILNKDLFIYVLNDDMYSKMIRFKDLHRKNCYVEKSYTKALTFIKKNVPQQLPKPITKVFINESLIRQKIRQNTINYYLN